MYDESKALLAVRFFEMLKHTKSPFYGEPFTLLPWEDRIIRDVYGTVNNKGLRLYKYVYIEVPKKNGKSEVGAGIALKQIFADGERNGEVYGCAGDREQATLVFDVAVEMIDQIPALKKRAKLNLSTKRITDKKTGTFYQVVSAEAYTKHGLNLSACIFDELHVQPNRDLWDVMTKGAGETRLQPLWVVITTSGDDPDRLSIGWEVHEKAKGILEARQKGDRENDIPFWYPVIYGYEGEDIYNEKNWYKANPSLDATFSIEKMREAATEAKLNKADERLFRWLRLNQWTTIKLTSWLDLDLFDATSGDWSRNELLGAECYIGGDFSTTTDLSGTCLLFPPQTWQTKEGDKTVTHVLDEWREIWDCWIPEDNMQERIKVDHVPYDKWLAQGWINATPGNVIDHLKIAERYGEYKRMYKIHKMRDGVMDGLPVDISLTVTLAQVIKRDYDLDFTDIPQTYASLTDPMNFYETLLKSGLISHEPNPVARWCMGNTSIVKNGNGQKKYVKETKGKSLDRTKRIDLTVASVMAIARARFYDLENAQKKLPAGWGM